MKGKILILLIVVLIGSGSIYIIYKDKNKKESNDIITTTLIKSKKLGINYKEEKYELKNVDQEVIISNSRNLPSITYYDNNVANKITNYLNNVSDKGWKNIKTQSDDLINSGFNESVIGVDYLFDTNVLTDNYLSVSLTESGGLGGVSWNDISFYNFSLSNGNILEFNDITNNVEELKNICYEYSLDYINNQDYVSYLYNDEISGKWQDILKNNMFNIGNWYIDKNGLNFIIEKYLIGPGNVENININIPYDQIKNYLNDYKLN